jgi:adenosylcobinamide kinase/adenosylcobinamide-phosphate guanylyltransferase
LRAAGPGEAVLVDCLTLWLTGILDETKAWDADDADLVSRLVDGQVDDLVDALRMTLARVVVVTNEVGSGVVPATSSGRLFRDLQGRVNARVAGACDEVLLVVAGQVVPLRGPAATVSP